MKSFLAIFVFLYAVSCNALTIINTAASSESTATAEMAKRALGMSASIIQETTAALAPTTTPATPKGPIAPPREDVAGKREKLSDVATLFVPDFYTPEPDGNITLVLFFHGAAWCAEQGFYHARRNGVLVSVSVPNYGYPQFVKDKRNIQEIIYGTKGFMNRNGLSKGEVKRIALASFSGGWTGVDAMLRDEQWSPLVSDVLLADSFYPRRNGQTELDPEMVAPILAFAKRAANAPKNTAPAMAFSYLFPPLPEHRGNTTNKAAEYLAAELGLKWNDVQDTTNTRGMKYGRRTDAGNLHLIGVEGMTTQDHFEHFYCIEDIFKLSSLTAVKPE